MEQKTEEVLEIERQKTMDALELKWLRAEHALTAALARIDELTNELDAPLDITLGVDLT